MTLALISNIANYLKYNFFWDCDGIDNVTLRLWKFSDFCSRHTVGVAGDDIMFHILVSIAIDLLTSEDRCFPWITAVPLPWRCLQSRQHSGSRMRGVTLALSGPPNLRPESDHRYLSLLLFRQPITSPKLYLLQSDLPCLYKLKCNIFNHHEILYFLCIGPHSNPPILLVGCDSWWRKEAEPSSWLCNDLTMTWAFHVLQKICLIKIS